MPETAVRTLYRQENHAVIAPWPRGRKLRGQESFLIQKSRQRPSLASVWIFLYTLKHSSVSFQVILICSHDIFLPLN
ncbi:hypothetical protein DWY91_21125 [Enterocloster bolteae]|uniref:Uncharacterized protein n=1 Tax=Enterocloster bolteae TaxID=208479 RepID=A0A412YZP9_9FIRM|nr:hypothetical protein DWY91_21125 [Enterocloster bolteae]RGV73065.1 hypothetical protein DWW02_21895 [Enterocloster bolteae]